MFNYQVINFYLLSFLFYSSFIYKEFGFDDTKELVKFWDRVQNGVVGNIKNAIENFRTFFSGVRNFDKTIGFFANIIDEFSRKVS